MIYTDRAYYIDEYHGATAPEAEIDRELARASEDIDVVTLGAAEARWNTLPESFKIFIKKATCAQAEHRILNGPEATGASDVDLGGFKAKAPSRAPVLCDRANRHLFMAGLACRSAGRA